MTSFPKGILYQDYGVLRLFGRNRRGIPPLAHRLHRQNCSFLWKRCLISITLLVVLTKAQMKKAFISFTLVNTNTNKSIRVLVSSGDVIDLQSIGTNEISIVAYLDDLNRKGSFVEFYLDGRFIRKELVAPFSIGSDNNGDYQPFQELVAPSNLCKQRNITAIQYNSNGSIASSNSLLVTVMNGPNGCFTNHPDLPDRSTSYPTDVQGYKSSSKGFVSGELRKWHKITIGFQGPQTSESSTPNPFTYYRLDVKFVHYATKDTFLVPGYYAADGNAANTGATSGNVWVVHFAPNRGGTWRWTAMFKKGVNAALSDSSWFPSAGFFDNRKGSFIVSQSNKTEPDLRSKGLLQYVGEHYLRFAGSGTYFIKAGVDSPENFLAYDEFDNTPDYGGRRKSWSAHIQDYRDNDPTWNGGKGKGIIGAINYLADQGMNAFSFLTMNIQGDDKNVFMYVHDNDYSRIDVSKTAQWEVLFEHADHLGMYLHFKTQETENDQLLDGGTLGNDRKLYYRELIARFGHHLALNWNLGEENTNSRLEQISFASYFRKLDPYKHHVVLHTYPGDKDRVYEPLLSNENITGVSLQSNPDTVGLDTREWIVKSSTAGQKWVVACDEQGPANVGVLPDDYDLNHDSIRQNVLWGNLMNNGAGVEYYFGYKYPNSDLTCEDFRTRSNIWLLSKHAIDFFQSFVPYWNMSLALSLINNNNNNDNQSMNASCLASSDKSIIVVYFPNYKTNEVFMDLSSKTIQLYQIMWYDPRQGGPLQFGTVKTALAITNSSIGSPPCNINSCKDWVAVIQSIQS